jgi:hypothetical protein
MAMSLHAFSQWLGNTPLSLLFQNVTWIIPAVQCVHIVCIAIVISSVFMMDLRLLNLMGRDQPTGSYAARFLPWIWYCLPILLVSGSILIIAEPARSLENPAFQLKMALLIGAMIATVILHRPIGKESAYWELTSNHRMASKVIAVASLLLWIGIIFCGRWIAYMGTSD